LFAASKTLSKSLTNKVADLESAKTTLEGTINAMTDDEEGYDALTEDLEELIAEIFDMQYERD
jgi:hypothetical protein